MDRVAKLTGSLDLERQRGLEIGPLHRPVLDKATTSVFYVDHAGTEDLRAKYAEDPEVDVIVDVDFVWGDRRLADVVGPAAPFDYVLASHVIEHVPDLVNWLQQLAEVLVDGGIVTLAIPDQRYCFDIRRPLTDVAAVVDAHLCGRRRPAPGAVFDFWSRLVAPPDVEAVWAGQTEYGPPTTEEWERGYEWARKSLGSGDYLDVHCWTFTPATFASILRVLSVLDLIAFEVRGLEATAPGGLEFFAVLGRLPRDLDPAERRPRQLAAIDRLVGPDAGDASHGAQAAGDGLTAPPAGRGEPTGGAVVMTVSAAEARLLAAKRRTLEALRRRRA